MRIRPLGLGQQRAVHVEVPARLEHQRAAQVVLVLPRPGAPLEHGGAPRSGPALGDQAERLPRRVGVNCPQDERFGSGSHDAIVCGAGGVVGNALLLTERDVRAVLPMPDLIDAMAGALAQFSAGAVSQPVRTVIEVGANHAYLRHHAGRARRPAGGRREAGDGLRAQSRDRPHLPPRHHRPARSRHRRAGGGDGRPVHHGGAHGRGVRGVSEASRAAGRAGAGHHRHRRAGAESPGGHPARAGIDRRPGLEPNRVASRPLRGRHGRDGPARSRRGHRTALRSPAPTSWYWRPRRGRRCWRTRTSPTARTSQPSAPAGPISARCRRRWSHAARVFVDSRAAARTEAGDLLIPMRDGAFGEDHLAGELGDLVSGRVAGRQDRKQVTIFKSLGLAVEDMVAAHLALTRARAAGLGQLFSW